jgi:hypothetical protein
MTKSTFLRILGPLFCGLSTLALSHAQDAYPAEAAAAGKTATATKCYEMRVYYAAPGKLDALLSRFRDHTTKLFEKHGMTNLFYGVPLADNKDNKLVYFLSYPSREAREKSWKGFMADPEWKKAQSESEKDGRLVAKVDSQFFHTTAFSPELKVTKGEKERVFELRTYTTPAGKLKNLQDRFANHTLKLFAKHGMENLIYWEMDKDQPETGTNLTYLLAHASKEASEASFKTFRDDPDWKSAKEASEKAAGGSLTVKDGVKSELLKPTDFSPTK